jgi:signal transduction histidine kinase
MTITEMRALYTEAVRIVRAERRMRAYVFRENPPMLEAKLREIDRLLDILEQIKDAAKLEAEAEQPKLLPPEGPRPRKYE